MNVDSRLARERKTLRLMIGMYCRAHHHQPDPNPAADGSRRRLCSACRELEEYALQRIGRCPFGAAKPTCARCPVHCYAPAMRRRIQEVMRFSGPRMLWRHPWLALRHLLDERRPPPAR